MARYRTPSGSEGMHDAFIVDPGVSAGIPSLPLGVL